LNLQQPHELRVPGVPPGSSRIYTGGIPLEFLLDDDCEDGNHGILVAFLLIFLSNFTMLMVEVAIKLFLFLSNLMMMVMM
jgi:hypothetical protein